MQNINDSNKPCNKDADVTEKVLDMYELEICDSNAELYQIAKDIVGVLPNPRLFMSPKSDSTPKNKWNPWKKLCEEISDISSLIQAESRLKLTKVLDYLADPASREPSGRSMYEFSLLFPIITYVYAHSDRKDLAGPIMRKLAASNVENIFLMSNQMSDSCEGVAEPSSGRLPYFCPFSYRYCFIDLPNLTSLASFTHVAPRHMLPFYVLGKNVNDSGFLYRLIHEVPASGDTGWVDVVMYVILRCGGWNKLSYIRHFSQKLTKCKITPPEKLQELFDDIECPIDDDKDLVDWLVAAVHLDKGDAADRLFLENADKIEALINRDRDLLVNPPDLHKDNYYTNELIDALIYKKRHKVLREYLQCTKIRHATYSRFFLIPSTAWNELFTFKELISYIFSEEAWCSLNGNRGYKSEQNEYIRAISVYIDASTPLFSEEVIEIILTHINRFALPMSQEAIETITTRNRSFQILEHVEEGPSGTLDNYKLFLERIVDSNLKKLLSGGWSRRDMLEVLEVQRLRL